MTNENETVLVTGGSGFIATHCILKLAAAGYKIKSTVRNLDRVTAVSYTHLTLPTIYSV